MIKSNCSDALLHDVKQGKMVALSAKKSKKNFHLHILAQRYINFCKLGAFGVQNCKFILQGVLKSP